MPKLSYRSRQIQTPPGLQPVCLRVPGRGLSGLRAPIPRRILGANPLELAPETVHVRCKGLGCRLSAFVLARFHQGLFAQSS